MNVYQGVILPTDKVSHRRSDRKFTGSRQAVSIDRPEDVQIKTGSVDRKLTGSNLRVSNYVQMLEKITVVQLILEFAE